MADTFTLKTEGFKELEEVLIQMGEDMYYDKTAKKVLVPAVKAALQPVARTMWQMSPYDSQNFSTPHMRDSVRIFARVPNNKDKRSDFFDKDTVVTGTVSVKADARRLAMEFGTAEVSPQPFIRASMESQATNVVNIFGTYLAYKLKQYKSRKV